jgi:hypothetical protein
MANHVTNIIMIEYPESQKEKILDIYESMKSELFTEIYEPVEDHIQDTRSWWEQNIGAKWVRLQDIEEPEEGSFMINLESAWSEVGPLVERIDAITNNECRIVHQFIDEMPNFFGCRVYEDGSMEEMVDWDGNETIENEAMIREKAENLTFDSDYDRDDWIWNWKWDFVHEAIDPENCEFA